MATAIPGTLKALRAFSTTLSISDSDSGENSSAETSEDIVNIESSSNLRKLKCVIVRFLDDFIVIYFYPVQAIYYLYWNL
jgi:hypothetical protein